MDQRQKCLGGGGGGGVFFLRSARPRSFYLLAPRAHNQKHQGKEALSAMSGLSNVKGTSGERGKERQVMLMHPQSSVVHGLRHFFPFGETAIEGRRQRE